MIRTVYKRKGRKYSVQTSFRPDRVVKIFRFLSRAFRRSFGHLTEFSTHVYAQVFNASGVWDCAEFPPGRLDLAKQWMYKAMRSKSPQLSLFGDGI